MVLKVFNNKVLLQWGYITGQKPATKTMTVTFPCAYTSKYGVFLQGSSADTSTNNLRVDYGYSYFGSIFSLNVTKFTCRIGITGRWFSIGY